MKTLLTLSLGVLLLGSQSGCTEEVQAHPTGSYRMHGPGWSPGQWMGPSRAGVSNQRWGSPNGSWSRGYWSSPGSWSSNSASTPAQRKARARLWTKYGKKIDSARLKLLKAESELRQLRWSVKPDPKAISAKEAEVDRLNLQLRTLQRRMWLEARRSTGASGTTSQGPGWHGGCRCGGGCGW